MENKTVTMAHGAGGKQTSELIDQIFKAHFANKDLTADDAAVLLPPVGKMAEAISSSFSIGNPSSMTNAQVRYSGLAPIQARSLTVPQIDSLPIFPPGKNAGETMKPSVETAIFPTGWKQGGTAAGR